MKINVKTSMTNYDIIIENGAFSNLMESISDLTDKKKVFIVTDDNVDALYGEKIEKIFDGRDFYKLVLPHGESTKSMKYLELIYTEMAEFSMSRSDIAIAFGGGVIGDITGFASATFLRGIEYIQIPTTLLSQVDSSVGGKVAIDLNEGKNLVGSFYPPSRVIIDPELLSTLPERVFNDGMAEVIKYSAIRDASLMDLIMDGAEKNLKEIIASCINIKKQIVENDEFDTGERMILNFGHTFGHAVEKLGNYSEYTHGEAVAIGMRRITQKSVVMGITKPDALRMLEEALCKYKLIFPDYTFKQDEAHRVITLDKKASSDAIKYIMISEIGKVLIKELPKTDTFLTED